MRILAEINRSPNVPHEGKFVCREAVRAIILSGERILLVHSHVNGDYKFPGGGIREYECHGDALAREVAEESGGCVTSTPVPFGKVLEFDFPIEKEFDSFCMTSYYYICEINPELGPTRLEDYEADLGFHPMWVDIHQAIENNHALMKSGRKLERWVRRETRVLEIIRDELCKRTT